MLKKLLIGLTALLTLGSFALAQQGLPEQLPITTGQYVGPAARPMGLGGTYTGIADDYSAIWWNPAGLAQVKRIEVQGSLSRSALNNETDYYDHSQEGTSSNLRLNNLGVVFPVPVYQGGLSFAFGYAQVQGFDGRTEFASPQNEIGEPFWDTYDEIIQGRMGLWSLAGAVDVTPNLALGVGVNYWKGLRDYSRTGTYTDSIAIFTEQTQTHDMSAWGANLGALFRLGRYARIGAMFQTPLGVNISQEFTRQTDSLHVITTSSGYFDYRMSYPPIIRFGASVAPGRWLVAADVELRDWTSLEFRSDTPYRVNGVPIGRASANQQIKSDYQNTMRLSVGGEYLFPAYGLRLRAGYAFEPSNYEPLGSDADKNLISLGFGFLVDRSVMIDGAVQFTGYSQRTADGSVDGYVDEDVSSTTALITIGYRM
ncbi:MAG: outer membrane protein transport protein [bacterium]|nr:outer membrane protein transport protein [bacterium]